LQQIAGAPTTDAAPPPILLKLFGHGREHLLRNQGRNLDSDAVGFRGVVDGDGATRLLLFSS